MSPTPNIEVNPLERADPATPKGQGRVGSVPALKTSPSIVSPAQTLGDVGRSTEQEVGPL
jgi:hypothetical protein